ncbi:MAG: hypothetical protein ACLUJE_05220 [Anaerococcus sp.]
MKKVQQKNIKKYTLLALTLIWLLFSIMLLYIKSRTSHRILIDFFGLILRQGDVLFILLLMIVVWLIYFLKLFWRKYSSKIARVFLVIGWILLILGFLFGALIFLGDHFLSSYHTFISPDKKHTLVVEETSFLLLGDVSLYERKNLLFIEDLGAEASPDDGFSPVSAGKYWIKWDGNRVNFAVFDEHGTRTWDVVKVSLGDSDRDVKHESLNSNGKPIIYEENDMSNPPRNHNIQKPSSKQDILDGLSIENAIIIPESNYALIEVDRDMAKSLWYFVRIEDDKMIYISEAPDTAPKVEGEIDSKGKIHLIFSDINNNQAKYESLNQGKTWKEK